MARRGGKEPEKKPNHERWLITYADLITLLMIFFVLMYTISNVNAKKFAQLSASMSAALLGQSSGFFVGESPGPLLIERASPGGGQETANMKKAAEQIQQYIEKQGLTGKVELTQEERGLVISLKEALLFKIGSADLTPEAREVVRRVGEILVTLPNNIRIEGHTCDLPINTAQFPSNWELSTARATNVVRFLLSEVNIKPEKISATGYGEFRPIVPNTSESNRARNRRVDIVVLRSALDVAEPGQQTKLIGPLNNNGQATPEGQEQ